MSIPGRAREAFAIGGAARPGPRAAPLCPRPDEPVPIYIAASGPAAARLAGRIADGFICTSGKGAELYTETLLPALAEGAAKAGRDAAGMDRMIEMKVSFDTDRTRALEDTREWAALALQIGRASCGGRV